MAVAQTKLPSEFQLKVYKLCYAIPRGKVATYGSIAKQLGVAPRAVGQAMRTNLYAPLVPCHRVVASNLTLGGFMGFKDSACGPLKKKVKMLTDEGVRFVSDTKLDPRSLYQFTGNELQEFESKWPSVIAEAEAALAAKRAELDTVSSDVSPLKRRRKLEIAPPPPKKKHTCIHAQYKPPNSASALVIIYSHFPFFLYFLLVRPFLVHPSACSIAAFVCVTSRVRGCSISLSMLLRTLRRLSTMASSDIAALVNDYIRNHKVVVFSKSYCPYCIKAKRALDSVGASYEAVELDLRSDGNAIQNYLAEMTGRRTVPNVFINGRTIGGGDDTAHLARTGDLARILNGEEISS